MATQGYRFNRGLSPLGSGTFAPVSDSAIPTRIKPQTTNTPPPRPETAAPITGPRAALRSRLIRRILPDYQ